MTSATFRVITQGLQPDFSPEMATDLLAALLKIRKEQVAPLLGARPRTFKKGLTFETATRYVQALERCGCACAIEDTAAPPAAALTPEQLLDVVPVVRRLARAGIDADPVVVQAFAGDLDVVFQVGPGGAPIRRSMLNASMLTVEQLYQRAVWNLYRHVHPHLVFRQMATGAPAGGRFFCTIETGDGLEASCLLLLPIWQTLVAEVQGPLRIVVPDAATCWYCGADDAVAFAMMSDIASETWSSAGAGALSGLTWSVDGAGQVTTVDGAHFLQAAPAPAPVPMIRAARLVEPELHAVAGNAALLTLSDARLRSVEPRLFDPVTLPNPEDRARWIALISNTLARGDCRAAVVVDAANAVVASYTDELDCIVLLAFDPALGQAHGWQNGTRLLSANNYVSRDKGIARDLQPGPDDTGRWGNFWPLIADLLTDDQDSLAARKRDIGAAEWDRTALLGRRALSDRVAPRDGRPASSNRPIDTQAQVQARAAPSASRRSVHGDYTFRDCLHGLGIFAVCALAVWGAGSHVTAMPHDALFYIACFGILAFGAVGLLCLRNAVNYLRN